MTKVEILLGCKFYPHYDKKKNYGTDTVEKIQRKITDVDDK